MIGLGESARRPDIIATVEIGCRGVADGGAPVRRFHELGSLPETRRQRLEAQRHVKIFGHPRHIDDAHIPGTQDVAGVAGVAGVAAIVDQDRQQLLPVLGPQVT